MSDVRLLSPTDSKLVRRTRRTVDILCSHCGETRPITAHGFAIFTAAANRPCRACAAELRERDNPERLLPPINVTSVACVTCGTERPIRGRWSTDFDRAASRPCRRCALREAHSSGARNAPLAASTARRYRAADDVDTVAVDRLVAGVRPPSWRVTTRQERLLAVARLTAEGFAALAIAERMNLTKRSVERLRAELRTIAETAEAA